MKKEKNSNSGFTLIELIIAMAILAFVMTAIVSFMSAGVYSYKKAKADVAVHNNAQSVYNSITDTTMQANNIVILAYENSGDKVDFTVPGADLASLTASNLSDKPCYYVRDEEEKLRFMKTAEYKALPNLDFVYFKDVNPDTELYVKSLIIESGVDIRIDECTPAGVAADSYSDAFAVEAGESNTSKVIKAVNKPGSLELKTDANGYVVYDTTDSLRSIYTFEGKDMYLQRKYRFMIARNDYLGWHSGVISGDPLAADDYMGNYTYCNSLSYVNKSDTEAVSGVIAKVDAKAGTIYYEFKFNDRNMTYESQGLAQIRNSYVLKPKANRLEITVGTSSEESSEEASTED